MTGVATVLPVVMAGPDPAIQTPDAGRWMPGSSPDLIRGPVMTGVATLLPVVMAGPDPAIQTPSAGGWMPGSSPDLTRGPGMTGVATVLSIVMAGLDPAIQNFRRWRLDARIKSGHDASKVGTSMPIPGPSPVMTSVTTVLSIVMAGPDPAIQTSGLGYWMPGAAVGCPGRARA